MEEFKDLPVRSRFSLLGGLRRVLEERNSKRLRETTEELLKEVDGLLDWPHTSPILISEIIDNGAGYLSDRTYLGSATDETGAMKVSFIKKVEHLDDQGARSTATCVYDIYEYGTLDAVIEVRGEESGPFPAYRKKTYPEVDAGTMRDFLGAVRQYKQELSLGD